MSNPQWKRTERRVAAMLGGRRVPITGRARGDAPDIAHEWLSLEVKERATLPAWLTEALAQASAAGRPGQLPVAVIHAAGTRYSDALVVLTLGDWLAWFGPAHDGAHGGDGCSSS